MLEYTSPNSTSTSLLTDTWNCDFVSKFDSFINNSFKMKQVYHFLMILFIFCFTTNLYSQSVPSYVPTNGLVGWWGFNGNAQDGSGNGNHGTVNGATLTTDRFGNQNGAYSFDGLSNIIEIPANNQFSFTSFSVSLWVNTNSSGALVNKSNWLDATSEMFAINLNNISFQSSIKINSNCSPGFGWNSTITNSGNLFNNWKHLVVSFNESSVKHFLNGLEINNQQLIGLMDNCMGGQIKFGAWWYGDPHFLNGKLDDIGIWNRALTQQEITNLYNSQLPTQTSLCLPTITTNTPTSIGIDSVVIGGDILNDGGSSIVLRGVCYSTTPNPNMGNPRTEEGSGIGSFTSTLRNLSPSTTYYARSYAKNSQGVVVYGNEVSFSTGTPVPGVRCPGTPSVTDIDGNVYNTVQIGNQCWMQSNLQSSRYRNGDPIPTGLSYTDWASTTSGSYATHYISGQIDSIEKKYNYFAVVDSRGLCPTGWHVSTDSEWNTLVKFLDINADTISFPSNQSTSAGGMLKNTLMWNICPSNVANNISGFSAVTTGRIHSMGGYSHSCRSHHWTSSNFDQTNAIYRYMEYYSAEIYRFPISTNSGLSVRCLKDIVPTVSTSSVSNVTNTSAAAGGDVVIDGGAPVMARGVAFGTSSSPTTSGTITNDGSGIGTFTSNLTGLTSSTSYYVRAYATNSNGTAYGNEVTFTTLPLLGNSCPGTPTVTDIDGNIYNTVQTGSQCWMQSNLKVSKYRNGDSIPTGLSNSAWQNATSGANSIYDNDTVNDGLYGKLYNHYAVMDTRGLCPTGWHIPTDGEWWTFTFYNTNGSFGAGSLKSTATQPTPGGWNSPNLDATNSSGFTALPGGIRRTSGGFDDVGYGGYWWSSSFFGSVPYVRAIYHFSEYFNQHTRHRTEGISVRCLRD
jgi:uncharacterized protein (TIGR02145 family)